MVVQLQKKASFLVQFGERMQTIAPISASFFKFWVSKDVPKEDIKSKCQASVNQRTEIAGDCPSIEVSGQRSCAKALLT